MFRLIIIVPICSDIVCGLEADWNMQIITEQENNQKSNKFWPDCPLFINGIPEQSDFFLDGKQNLLIL